MADFNSKTFNAEAFGKYMERIPDTKKQELLRAGVFTGDKNISDTFATQTGQHYAVIPMKGLIGGTPLNYDGKTDITAETTKTYTQGVVALGRAMAWYEEDFSYDITGGVDFMGNVASQVAVYWSNVYQSILLSILKGVFATKDKEFASHTYDISDKTGDESKVGATTLNSATAQACGDNKNKFDIVIMHSVVATNLENLQVLTNFKVNDANGMQRDVSLASWNGRTVFIDDSMPMEKVTGGSTGQDTYKYTTYILGRGAFKFADLVVKVPNEMFRNPLVHGGKDQLITRRRFVIAPFGFSFTKTDTVSPSDKELEKGENWALVKSTDGDKIDVKAIPIARIVSKG